MQYFIIFVVYHSSAGNSLDIALPITVFKYSAGGEVRRAGRGLLARDQADLFTRTETLLSGY